MKFKCPECGGIMFEVAYKDNRFAITNPISIFTESSRLKWTSDPIDEEYYAICTGCNKEWMAGSYDGLKNEMKKDGVLK
jgi:hypothetical protein